MVASSKKNFSLWPSRTHNDIINLSEIKTKKISWIGKDYGKNKCSFKILHS